MLRIVLICAHNVEQIAVCNLASIALNRYVTADRKFDFKQLEYVTSVVVKNLNKIINVNYYPVPEVKVLVRPFVLCIEMLVVSPVHVKVLSKHKMNLVDSMLPKNVVILMQLIYLTIIVLAKFVVARVRAMNLEQHQVAANPQTKLTGLCLSLIHI